MKSKLVLLLLKSMAINYPILQDEGYIFSKVIRLIVPAGLTMQAVNCLYTPSSKMVDLCTKRTDLPRIIDDTSSGIIFLTGESSPKLEKLIGDISDYVKSGVNTLVVYVTDSELNMIEGNFFELLLDDKIVGCPSVEQLVPRVDELALVEDIISKAPLEDAVGCERTLLAGVCFLYPRFPEQKRAELLDEYFCIVRQMCDLNEVNSCDENIRDLFINALYQYLENGLIRNAVALPNIEDRFEDIKDDCIFYDEKYLYMSTIFLKKVIEPLQPISPVSIKKALSDKDVLVHDKDTYTNKMSFCRPTGKEERVRMMQFRKDLLTLPGQIRFIDMCLERSGDCED